METPLRNHQAKCLSSRDISNTSDIRFLMVYRTIIDVILHLFIICNDLWCQLPFFSQTFRHNGSAVFGTIPPMCRSCPDVNKLRGMETTILGQHRPFMSIKSFVQHSGWQEMVSLCSLIRLIGVCADRDHPEFLCSRSDSRHLEVHVAAAGGWFTRYRPREVRNSIYRYRKIHIDYRSKFLYRFISPISIIYGNTINNIPVLVQIMTRRFPVDKPLSEPLMVSLQTHIQVTWPQWVNSLDPGICGCDAQHLNTITGPQYVNSLLPSDGIWWHRLIQ